MYVEFQNQISSKSVQYSSAGSPILGSCKVGIALGRYEPKLNPVNIFLYRVWIPNFVQIHSIVPALKISSFQYHVK
jgi:hypothetical protein